MRTECIVCSHPVDQFLDLGETPLADRFPTAEDEIEKLYPLRVGTCSYCKLVQLLDIVPDSELYSDDYAYYTGASKSHNPYWEAYSTNLKTRFGSDKSVLEIACNDGSLLKHLDRDGFKVMGIDPASGPLMKVPENIATICAAFTQEKATKMRALFGTFDIVVANNVLAHVADPNDFVQGLRAITHRESVVVVEVQYLADLLAGNQFDHFYHEHRSFFSVRTLSRLFMLHGFWITDVQQTEAQGGSIRVFFTRDHVGYEDSAQQVYWAQEKDLDEFYVYDAFGSRVEHITRTLVSMVDRLIDQKKIVAGYGATAKSCTLLNYAGIGRDHLRWMQDTTPWKQGKFTPGTKIPVVSPAQEVDFPDAYLVTAWNYLPKIFRIEMDYLQAGGQLIVPLPKPVIL